MIVRNVLVAAALAVGVGTALAQSDVLPSTKLMKQQGQHLYRGLGSMVKGEAAFDQAKAEELFAKLVETSSKIAGAFPESSKGKAPPDARYAASPKVWEDKDEFSEHIAKLANTLRDNQPKAKSLEGLKAAYSAVNDACNSCHDIFRLRKS